MSDGVRTPADEQDFQIMLESLRNNDPNVTDVNVSQCWDGMVAGYGGDLGRALAENTVVSSIDLNIKNLLSASETTAESAVPLVQYLRNSQTLRKVRLKSGPNVHGIPPHQDLEDALLNALAGNAYIESLNIVTLDMRPTSRIHLLREKLGSLKELSISLRPIDINHASHRLFESANSAILPLTRLSVFGEDNEIFQLLPQLTSLRNLCRLDLNTISEEMTASTHLCALAQFLYSTTTLSHLSLNYFKFRGDDANDVMLAIAKSRIATLHLLKCEFDPMTTDAFIRLVQGSNEQSSRALSDLRVAGVKFDDHVVGQVLALCLIGSPLTKLYWMHQEGDSDQGVGAFFDSLATMPAKILLGALSLPRLRSGDADSMARFLPQSTSLRQLHMDPLCELANCAQLLSAVRQNGSLYFTPDRQLVHRNILIPEMMKIPLRDDTYTNGHAGLRLLPTMFKAAQGAPRTAPNVMLIGLMTAAGDVIGRKLGAKRRL
jgi:hypothetical protein